MTFFARLVDDHAEAERIVKEWMERGVSLSQIGLLMSETTRARTEGNSTVGAVARNAVLFSGMGIMAAGSIVEDLAGMKGGLVDALAGWGLRRAAGARLLAGLQRGGLVVVAFTDDEFAAPAAPREEPEKQEEQEEEEDDDDSLEHVQFLNLAGLPDARDPTARRFCLLEVD